MYSLNVSIHVSTTQLNTENITISFEISYVPLPIIALILENKYMLNCRSKTVTVWHM